MTRRRHLLIGGAAATGAAVAGGGAAAFRLHAAPRRGPYLTEAHLAALRSAELPRPRVLFVGNSMVLRNDLADRVADRALADGVALSTAVASANGARLVETVRLSGFRAVLRRDWDAVVLQDFTKTPLRGIDRWGSARAVGLIARTAAPAPLLLYPPNPARGDNAVYRDAGFLTAEPSSPRGFADRAMSHYGSLGHRVVPVPHSWIDAAEAGAPLYEEDGHHPSPAGTDLIAGLIWTELAALL